MIGLLALAATAAPAMSVAETERAFAAAAQTEGQWAAFRRFMAPDAVMIRGGWVDAAKFLATAREPVAALRWAPERTITSCDQTLALSTGPWWSADGKQGGRYFTIWKKQPDGSWKWLRDGGIDVAKPLPLDVPLTETKAACPSRRYRGIRGLPPPMFDIADYGWSDDYTLVWMLHDGNFGPHAPDYPPATEYHFSVTFATDRGRGLAVSAVLH